ncbi:hypothetical protein BRD56_07010 [Thermoplasmatales archaeon SW_10_69_26]|nr:MAG: hypothetical protein BRD56_07010 [Thermoplasmatales archaeon SW_10_69_26]
MLVVGSSTMSLDATHLAIAFALLAAPAVLGVASYTDTMEDETPSPAAMAAAEGETIETFEGDVPEDVTAGTLDLRIDRGTVKVVGWSQDKYKIDVLEASEETTVDDGETEATFEETTEEDAISLSLVVDHTSTTNVDVESEHANAGDQADRAIVAHVPQRLTYESIHACEGEGHTTDISLVTLSPDGDCVDTSQPTIGTIRADLDGHDDDGLDVSWGLSSLEGESARMLADDGLVQLEELDFARLGVATDNGKVNGTAVTASQLTVETDNGAIDLEADADEAALATDNGDIGLVGDVPVLDATSDNGHVSVASSRLSEGSIETDNGGIDMKTEPIRSGELSLVSDNGAIEVFLAHGDDIGYEVTGASDNGPVEVELVDEESDDETEAGDERGPDHSESARTAGYEDRSIQQSIDAETDNGPIEIREQGAQSDSGSSASGSAGFAGLR